MRLVASVDAIREYSKKTLLAHTIGRDALNTMVEEAVADLKSTSLIKLNRDETYEATSLGQAVVAASLTPEDGLFIYKDFKNALQAVVMDGEMQIFYMFTPLTTTITDINWPAFRSRIGGLDESGLRVLEICKIKPFLVNQIANGGSTLPDSTPSEVAIVRTYRRFYTALILHDLCHEVSTSALSRTYGIPRGHIQNLAQSAHGFAAGMINFCQRMGWGMLSAVLEHMSDRLLAGAQAELLELAKIPFVKSKTARQMWQNGYRSIRAVADADPDALVQVLLVAQPGKRKGSAEEEETYLKKLRTRAEIIIQNAGRLWDAECSMDIDDEG